MKIMTPQQVIDQARYLTRTDSSDGAANDSDMLRVLNDYYRRMVNILVNLNEDKFGRKGFTTLNMNPNQEYYRLPSDCMKLKRLEITYDGTTWDKIRLQDPSEQRDYALDSTDINNQYVTSDPRAEIFGDSIYLRPIPTTQVSNGLKLWYIRLPGELSALSNSFSLELPDQFKGYLAYGVAAEIATRQANETVASMMFQKWEDAKLKIEQQFPPTKLDYEMDFQTPSVDYS